MIDDRVFMAGFFVLSGLAVAFSANVALAEPMQCDDEVLCVTPSGGASGGDTTSAFVGLRWDFGAAAPALTGGVRHLKSDDGDRVYGAQFEASLPLTGDNHLPKLRLLGVAGTQNVQGLIGGGFDFGKNTALISGGLQASHVEAGLDYGLDGSLAPYVGANSLTTPEFASGALTCPNNYLLTPVENGIATILGSPVEVLDQFITNGQSCVQPPP